jgi:aerobic carbon-monoxide dehydrogenase small subunit
MANIRFTVNGKASQVETEPDRPLLEVLREDLGLTGTKYGCGEGQCGACTVLLDGRPVLSCITPVRAAEEHRIVTIEGLARDGRLHPVQQAFVDEGAAQCGYCTPGMILQTAALLAAHPQPSDSEIVEALNGNLCRCNDYHRIHAAVRRAAEFAGRKA